MNTFPSGSDAVAQYGKIYERLRTSGKDLSNIELEYVYGMPKVEHLSRLFSSEKIKVATDSYIEYLLYRNTNEGNLTKTRLRFDFAKIDGLELTNQQLLDYIDNAAWETKEQLDVFTLDNNFGAIITSSETPDMINKIIQAPKINMVLVNRIRVAFKEFILDCKLKRKLGNCRQGNISNLYKSISNPKNPPIFSLEIEHIGKFKRPWKDIEGEFVKLTSWVLGHDVMKIHTSTYNPPMIQTSVITPKFLLTEVDPTQFQLTPKIDGCLIHFIIKPDGSCFVSSRCVGKIREVWEYEHCLKITEELSSAGEFIMIDNVRYIYPFSGDFDFLDSDFLDKHQTIPNKVTSKTIIFRHKPKSGPFADLTDMLSNIYSMSVVSYNVKTDGLILSSAFRKGTQDYKLKGTADVDVLGKIRFTYAGKTDPRQVTETGLAVIMDLFAKTSDSDLKSIVTKTVDIGPDIEYLSDIFCIKVKNFSEGMINLKTAVIPISFICEYDQRSSHIKFRLEKTTKYITEKYYGNGWQVIQKILSSAPPLLDLNLIYEWIHNPESRDQVLLQNFKTGAIQEDEFDLDRLNTNATYFKENRIRSPLGYVSNFIKSLLIGLYASKMFYGDSKRARVCSIDFGNGADLSKYFYAGIQELVATDPDQSAIDTALDRYGNLNKNEKSTYYKFSYSKSSIRAKNYIDVIKGMTTQLNFDIIDWQFAIHFSWHYKHIPIVMHNLCTMTKPGGRVIITTLNGKGIEDCLDKDDTVTFKIHPIEASGYTKITKTSPETFSVLTPLTTTTPMTEYIVNPTQLIETFYRYGFILLDNGRFDEILNANIPFFKAGSLLETRPSSANFFTQQRCVLHDIVNTDLPKLLRYYVYFVFQRGI